MSWYDVEQDGVPYRVQAASRSAAQRYLTQCLKEPRPFEPGYAIMVKARDADAGH